MSEQSVVRKLKNGFLQIFDCFYSIAREDVAIENRCRRKWYNFGEVMTCNQKGAGQENTKIWNEE